MRAGVLGLAAFAFATISTFYICAKDLNDRYNMFQHAFKRQNFKELKRGEVPQAPHYPPLPPKE